MLKTIATLFAKPIGAAINNALAAGSAAVIAWSISKGIDGGIVTPIVAGVVNVLSLALQALANSQGVQIPIINQDASNGVTVVNARDARDAGIPAANAPKA